MKKSAQLLLLVVVIPLFSLGQVSEDSSCPDLFYSWIMDELLEEDVWVSVGAIYKEDTFDIVLINYDLFKFCKKRFQEAAVKEKMKEILKGKGMSDQVEISKWLLRSP